MDPVYFELKENAKLEFLRPHPISKVHECVFKKEVGRLVVLGFPVR